MQTVDQSEHNPEQTERYAAYQAGKVRWKQLTDRLADEIARGYSLSRIVTEAELNSIGGGRDHVLSVDRLRAWSERYGAMRGEGRYVGELILAESIEAKLEAWFELLDTERATSKSIVPQLVKTSVSEKVWSGFLDARELCEVVEIDAPPGAGKTCATDQYLAQCRKLEGFTCPVWRITLSEFSVSLKSVLQLIAHEIDADFADSRHASDKDLKDWIEMQTKGRGGLLIVDEAQHIGDTNKLHGLTVINGLRHLVDRKLFGVALLSNGEVYRRVRGGKHTQLSSRMEDFRVAIKGVTEEDIEVIMAAYGVSGKAARTWCIEKAKTNGVGSLRTLVNAFRKTHRKFGEVNYQTLTMLERL